MSQGTLAEPGPEHTRMLADDEPPASRWPTAIGVISLIYAILGLMCQLGYGSYFALGDSIPEMWRGGAEFPTILRQVGGAQVVLTLIAGVIMLLGAVALLKRRRKALALLKTWVALRLVLAAIGLATSIVLIPASIQIQRSVERYLDRMAAENPGRFTPPPPKTDEQISRQAVISAAVMTAVFSAYPVFLGFWLTRRSIVAEISRWE